MMSKQPPAKRRRTQLSLKDKIDLIKDANSIPKLSQKDLETSSMNTGKKDKILVAAIDFGTTFSGYAFSFKHDYKEDPMNIKANNSWFAGSMSLVSLKAPTCVLLGPDKQFLSFGFETEDKYSELALDEEHQDHYFFKRFKMILAKKKLTRDIQIKDDYGKSYPAKALFGHVIRYLKNHLLDTLETRGTGLDNKDIHWVLTVPAIWSDSAKQFMRESANDVCVYL